MIDYEQIRKLSPADGDIFVVPEDTPCDLAKALAEAIAVASPGVKALVFRGDLHKLPLAEMNAAGWYRA
ncbi:hypothetical protein BK652_17805 [Pseudomonas brassicacearum]|uniref:Uncharacterized protein n=1 Tax=Pseudomonas brassicacearum TaxID=930166 RepID=A0A423G4Q0_9PSED|nr:hypothetical protein [Pseudomonas brassicacearum]ROM80512.1 hypothetical protein BK652_17805 [Pseudomonas brassicacearum]